VNPGYAVRTVHSATPGLPGDRHDNDNDNDNNNNESSLRLSLDDRIELYNKTFDSNGNQLTLKNKHIVKEKQKKKQKKKKKEKENEGEEEEENTSIIKLGNGDNDPPIYLSVESDRVLKVVGDTMCSKRGLVSRNSSNNGSTASLCIDVKEKKKKTVSGTCVICLVEYVKDDVIVLSEDLSCQHVYHKECMVNYLASSAQEKIKRPLAVIDNPCPVCRRPDYCTVCDEDVAQILLQKTAVVATNATTTSAYSSTSTTTPVSPVEAVPVPVSSAEAAFSEAMERLEDRL